MDLGNRIKETRMHAGMSGSSLAERAGIPQSTLSRIENTPDAEPSVFTIARIAKVLGVSIDDLIGDVKLEPIERVKNPQAELIEEIIATNRDLAERLKKLESEYIANFDKREAMLDDAIDNVRSMRKPQKKQK